MQVLSGLNVGRAIGTTLGVAGLGVGTALGAKALTNYTESKGGDASIHEIGVVHGGIPLLGLGSLAAVPSVFKAPTGGLVPAAMLGALGLGTLGGVVAATVDD